MKLLIVMILLNARWTSVYVKQIRRRFVFLVLCVNDILLVSNEARFQQDTKIFFSKRFDMKDMGEATYVLGSKLTEIGVEDLLDYPRRRTLTKS